ncbi:MAG TPA: S8 family serine peptidase [Solirubrobacteraceae bacterium]|nr:S8 family serine peptidase [Solirubrobacteraceae bacterium]
MTTCSGRTSAGPCGASGSLPGLGALLALLLALASAAPASAASRPRVGPLPRADYGARAVCRAPAARHASCLAYQLVPRTAAARAHTHPLGVHSAPLATSAAPPSPTTGDFGLRPSDLHSAYDLPTVAQGAQTVAIVDAYNDLAAEEDLAVYTKEFSLPACTAGEGCFAKVNQNGESANLPFPKTAKELETARKGTHAQRVKAEEALGWALEISLDIETVRAVCQSCHILLVEADSPTYEDLEAAERTAATLGAGEISNSWGGSEHGVSVEEERNSPFDHPGVVISAASGDDGYLDWGDSEKGYAEYPASSPHVVAVGGTRLTLGEGDRWAGEAVWNGYGAGGGGCSTVFAAQPFQQSVGDWSAVGCASKRAVNDVSADADPYTGLAVYDSSLSCEYEFAGHFTSHWCTIGGTSLATPTIAATFALAGGANGTEYPAQSLYEGELRSPGSLHDVSEGSNGECTKGFDEETGLSYCTAAEEAQRSCSSRAICLAGAGYDGPTGVGTPDGLVAFAPQPVEPPPPPPAEAPEFGRCVKVAKGAGAYGNPGCTKLGGGDSYEWHSRVTEKAFTIADDARPAVLETTARTKVTCAGASGAGEYTGAKTTAHVTLELTGCSLAGQSCASGGIAGQVATVPLEGELGIEKLGATARQNRIALHLYTTAADVSQFHCGATAVSVSGSVLVPVRANRMAQTTVLDFKAAGGHQKPEGFVEGARDVLEGSFAGAPGEQLGLALKATQTNGESIEVNSTV